MKSLLTADVDQVKLGELLNNAITHASSPVGAYAAAQVHQRAADVQLAVADAGIGIPSHLARNPALETSPPRRH